ncbi:hypothetical protein DFO83_102125 [Idiomarina loihiensis]|uniref:hypothetical protein n=1 Tax=Idiomarina TaxID=135575 RepID=UPI000D70A83A|nr:hypothetical protein [Idiomarina]PWW40307.1 hypothetical protein DFO83_102125 [Idiomarina loihiensis]TDP49998.1 hypothetical protein DET58_102121 [Idiomarina loihiensis]TDS24650.1 hypothetical protein DET62_102259 [Idiomarina sp. H2]
MDLLRKVITEHATPQKSKIEKASINCADTLMHLICREPIDTLNDAHKEMVFSTIYDSVHAKKSLSSKFRRALIDAINQKLYGQHYYSTPRLNGFVDPKIVKAKSLLHGAINEVNLLVSVQKSFNNSYPLFLVLFHAAFESGLCFEEALDALLTTVTTSKVVLKKIEGNWVIPLIYSRRGHETNTKANRRKVTQRNFYPGPLTLFTISGFIKSRATACISGDATTLLKNELSAIASQQAIKKLNNRTFLRAVAQLVSEQPGSNMPTFLRHFAGGDLSSASTSIECLQCIKSQTFHNTIASPTQPNPVSIPRQPAGVLKKRDLPAYHSEFSEGLRELFKARNDHHRSAAERKAFIIRRIDSFYESRKRTISDSEFVLIDWLRYCYREGNLTKFATGARYVSSVATIWLDVCQQTSVFVLDEDEMTELYEQLMNKKSLSDSQYSESIIELMHFLNEEHDIALPQQLEPRDKQKSVHVRSNIPSEVHIKQLFTDIGELYANQSSHLRESVIALLILCSRLNPRPNEVLNLEIKDIDLLLKGHLFVRTNRHFREKTYSAKRLIELDTFLPPDESKFIRWFISRRMEQAGRYLSADGRVRFTNPHMLIFSRLPHNNVFLNMREISQHVTRLLSSYTGVHTPMYQLRHFAISTAVLVCFASDDTVRALTPYSPEQVAVIRDYFQLSDSLNVLYKISTWAGHLEPGMTLSTYTHFTDLLLFESIMRSNTTTNMSSVRNLSRMQPARMSKLLPEGANAEALNKTELMSLADRLLSKERGGWVVKQLKGIKKGDLDMDSLFTQKTEFDAEQVSLVLEASDKGRSIEQICDLYNLERKMVEALIDAARDTKERYKTKHRKFRLYAAETSKLHVPLPNSNDDIMAANIIINKLMPAAMHYLDNQVRKASHILLSASTHSHRYVSFNTKEIDDAINLITALKPVVPASRLYLEIHVDNSICGAPVGKYRDDVLKIVTAHWNNVLNAVGHFEIVLKDGGKRQNSKGVARLYFLSHDINENNAQYLRGNSEQYASSALRYAFHTLAIYSGALRRYYDPRFTYDPNNIYELT